jgi:hypothetical protein
VTSPEQVDGGGVKRDADQAGRDPENIALQRERGR